MQRHGAAVPVAPMLEQINSLPRPEHEPPGLHGHREVRLCQDRANVSRHVVGALCGMAVEPIVLGYQPLEECHEVADHVGVGVLLNRQGRRGVADVYGHQSCLESQALHPAEDGSGDLGKPLTAGLDVQVVSKLFHGQEFPSLRSSMVADARFGGRRCPEVPKIRLGG